jgi:glycosyltransferase involved in cell wall biosynthesis
MKSVLLRAPLLTHSGYGVHARQVARWLFRVAAETHQLDITTETLGWGKTHMIVDTEAEDGLIGQILQASANKKNFYDVTIQLQLPNEWNPFLGNFNIGMTAGVETDKCNPAWIDCINRMDMIIVPSEFTKQTFLNTGEVTVPIVVVPESFPDAYLDCQTKIDLNLETKFNFLLVGQLTGNNVDNDRKNIPYTLKYLADLFADEPDVGIIIKTNAGAQTQLDKRNVQGVFSQILGEVRKPNAKGPRFYLLHGHMTDEEMYGLYTDPTVKALVSLTHGEGYGLPILEAAACGLPVIATNWSGHLEFLKHGRFIPVEQALQEIHPSRVDNQIFMKGVKWAVPSESDSKYRIKKFYNGSDIPKEWAKDLQAKVKEKFSFEAVAKIYSETLNDCLKAE